MLKFASLALFIGICLNWIYQPYEIKNEKEMIEKYRHKFYQSPKQLDSLDIQPIPASYPTATALHFSSTKNMFD